MPRHRKPKRRQRGSGSISVAADGTIRARVPAALNPKRPAREFRPGQRAEAEAWLNAQLHPPPASTGDAVTLRAWAGSWWQTYVEPIMAPNTSRRYLYQLRELGPALLGMTVADVRPSHVQAAIAAYAGRVSPASVHIAAGVWRACFEAAVDDGLIDRNPARRLVLPRTPPRPAARHLTADEATRLLDAARGHPLEVAFALLIGCGLRIGEVLGLAWRNVDLAGHRVLIERQWTEGRWRDRPKAGPPRWVRLPPPVVRALIRHRNAQPAGTTLVLQSTRRGRLTGEVQPWSYHYVSRELGKLAAEIGIPALSSHAGRRGIVTTLLDAGLSLASAAAVVGHRNTATTLRYAQATDAGAERAAQIVDAYLGEGASEADTAC